jgi:hypothetical protein
LKEGVLLHDIVSAEGDNEALQQREGRGSKAKQGIVVMTNQPGTEDMRRRGKLRPRDGGK